MLEEDEELAEDEEEILVYVEFDGSVAGNTFGNEKLHLDMIGLDKEHPIMQVNGKFYEGTYQDAVGTYMFFENDKNPPVDDPVFDAIPSIKYCAKTRKVLRMHRIFVEPKTEMLGDSNDAEFVPSMETIRKAGIPPKYQDAALESWETMRNNRMDALNRYLEKQRLREEKRAQGIEPDSESDDDNPFAMYKPDGAEKKMIRPEDVLSITEKHPYLIDDEEADEHSRDDDDDEIGQDSQPLTIIDPGPSTSKDSKPWSSPSAPEEPKDSGSDFDETYMPSKNRVTVKVAKKGKLLKKALTKKPNKKGKQTRKFKDKEDLDWKETNEIDEAEAAELLSKDLESLLEVKEKDAMIAPDVSIELTQSKGDKQDELETINVKRKLDKQQKREEKMRLMAEKLKKAAEESKIKAQQRPEGGV